MDTATVLSSEVAFLAARHAPLLAYCPGGVHQISEVPRAMDILASVRQVLKHAGEQDEVVQKVLQQLDDIHGGPVDWSSLREDFEVLMQRGIWKKTEDNQRLLNQLEAMLTSAPSTSDIAPGFSIIHPSPSMDPPMTDATFLPPDVVEYINVTLFLHLLATNPAKVLPPGKSLLSVMTRPRTRSHADEETSTLQERVSDAVHKAFWDEASIFR
jgi:hypothetical protein